MLAWICTEAVRTGSREIVLGRSLSEFMRKLGISSTGGRGQARLRNQMKRLFNCSVQLNYTAAGSETSATALVAELTDFWWNPKHPDQTGLWESKVRLSEAFFNEIVSHPVPLDLTTLKALKRSPLGLDLYLWITYRIFALTTPQRLTWRRMYQQFGAHPAQARDKRNHPKLPAKGATRVEEDQDRVAGVELRDGSGHPDPLSIFPAHFTGS